MRIVESGKPASRAASRVSCCAAGSKDAGTVMARSWEANRASGCSSFHAEANVFRRIESASTGLIWSADGMSGEPRGRKRERRSAAWCTSQDLAEWTTRPGTSAERVRAKRPATQRSFFSGGRWRNEGSVDWDVEEWLVSAWETERTVLRPSTEATGIEASAQFVVPRSMPMRNWVILLSSSGAVPWAVGMKASLIRAFQREACIFHTPASPALPWG